LSSSSANGGLAALFRGAAGAAAGAAAAPAGGTSAREGSSVLVGSGLAGADGLLGRCLTYSLQLNYIDIKGRSTVDGIWHRVLLA